MDKGGWNLSTRREMDTKINISGRGGRRKFTNDSTKDEDIIDIVKIIKIKSLKKTSNE
jgi:hypothetical protein